MQLNLAIKRPAVRYHGSKFRMAPWILSFFPPHSTYCEPFAGGAGVLLRKEPSSLEIYNDLDSDVVNYFRVLRDPETCSALVAAISLTPFSREEYRACFEPSDLPVERARRFATRSFLGFGSHSHNIDNITNGFRTARTAGKATKLHSYAHEWAGVPGALLSLSDRLRYVTIEQLDASVCIPKYDGPETLFYLDPPYVRSARQDQSKGYAHELCDHQHRELAWLLNNIQGRAILSGYDTPLYRDLYPGWHREQTTVMANGQWGAVPRTEVLWMNFPPVRPDSEISNLKSEIPSLPNPKS